MAIRLDRLTPVTSWTNGRKAVVHLLQDEDGGRVIRKVYRPGFRLPMFREYLMTRYVSSRLPIGPRVLGFRPWRSELLLEYLPGQRVLEWVLGRFGRDLDVAEFQSFHGLSPPDNVESRVAEAFARFRRSTDGDVLELKAAIRAAYDALHGVGVEHGSADPRNVLYEGGRIFIIDFDNAGRSADPGDIDDKHLEYWYGIAPPGRR